MADKEREERALDAILVMCLRGADDDLDDPGDLPELTGEERKAMEALGDDLIDRLIAKEEADRG